MQKYFAMFITQYPVNAYQTLVRNAQGVSLKNKFQCVLPTSCLTYQLFCIKKKQDKA